MNIKDNNRKPLEFKDLSIGDIFQHEGIYYIKTVHGTLTNTIEFNALNLDDASVKYVNHSAKVNTFNKITLVLE